LGVRLGSVAADGITAPHRRINVYGGRQAVSLGWRALPLHMARTAAVASAGAVIRRGDGNYGSGTGGDGFDVVFACPLLTGRASYTLGIVGVVARYHVAVTAVGAFPW